MAGTTDLAALVNQVIPVVNQDAILEAQPNFVFRKFVEEKTNLRREAGRQINFYKINNLTQGKKIDDEYTPMPRSSLSSSTVTLTTYEFGNSIQYTRQIVEASFRDVMEDAGTQLGRDYAQVMDNYLRDTFLQSTSVQWAGGVAADNLIADGSVFNTAEIKDAVEALKVLNVAPFMRNGQSNYICIAHPSQLRKLRDDSAWINARQYVDPSDIYAGEVGRYENVIFFETTQMPVTPTASATGKDVYSAVLFGERAVGYAEQIPMEIVTDGPQDFNRFVSLGWYTVAGATIINDNIIHMRTCAV